MIGNSLPFGATDSGATGATHYGIIARVSQNGIGASEFWGDLQYKILFKMIRMLYVLIIMTAETPRNKLIRFVIMFNFSFKMKNESVYLSEEYGIK